MHVFAKSIGVSLSKAHMLFVFYSPFEMLILVYVAASLACRHFHNAVIDR